MRRANGPWLGRSGGIALATALAGSTAWGGGAAAATLGEALVGAYQTNPQLQGQRATLQATDELVAQALAGYRPQVFLNGAVQGTRGQVGQNQSIANRLL